MKDKNLISFSLKLLAFGLILFLIIIKFFLPYAPDIGEEKNLTVSIQKLDEKDSNFYDILFFTNSYLYTSIDPIIIKESLGLEALHVASGAQRLETALIIANEVLKKHKPSYIVFDVSTPTLPSPEIGDKKLWYFQTVALQEIPFSMEKGLNVTKFFPIKKHTEEYISAMSKPAGRLFRINELPNYNNHGLTVYNTKQKNVYFNYNSFRATNTFKTVDDKLFQESFYKEPEPIKNRDYLFEENLISLMNDFLEKTSRKGIEVIFIHSLKMTPTAYDSKILEGWVEN